MVKSPAMLISEFSRAVNLSPDTVRFYVKRGILKPDTGLRGGSNPYQVFDASHVEIARLVKLAQSLGFTLREISAISIELQTEGISRRRRIGILKERLTALEDKAAEIARMTGYIRAKIAWMEKGEKGAEPVLDPGFAGGPLACPEDLRKPRAKKSRRQTDGRMSAAG